MEGKSKKKILIGVVLLIGIVSILTIGAVTRISDEEIFTTGTLSVGDLEVDGTLSSNFMLRIKSVDIPNCNFGKRGGIARNDTSLYFCNGSIWRSLIK